MKGGFKTNKFLTAVAETGHTVTTSEGRIIHKKLACIQAFDFSDIKKARIPEETNKQMPQMWEVQ